MFMFNKFNENGANRGFMGVTISVAFFVLVAIATIAVLLNEKNLEVKTKKSSFKLADIKLVLKNKKV